MRHRESGRMNRREMASIALNVILLIMMALAAFELNRLSQSVIPRSELIDIIKKTAPYTEDRERIEAQLELLEKRVDLAEYHSTERHNFQQRILE